MEGGGEGGGLAVIKCLHMLSNCTYSRSNNNNNNISASKHKRKTHVGINGIGRKEEEVKGQ